LGGSALGITLGGSGLGGSTLAFTLGGVISLGGSTLGIT